MSIIGRSLFRWVGTESRNLLVLRADSGEKTGFLRFSRIERTLTVVMEEGDSEGDNRISLLPIDNGSAGAHSAVGCHLPRRG